MRRRASCLIDVILDEAGQKGTGKWTSQAAMDLQVPVPVIDAAVSSPGSFGLPAGSGSGKQTSSGTGRRVPGNRRKASSMRLEKALQAGFLMTYAQGMALLRKADAYGYGLNLADVARIWRGGCIIRAALLEEIRASYQNRPDLANLLLDPHLGGTAAAVPARPEGYGLRCGQSGNPGSGDDGGPGLFRRLPQRPAAGQPHPGPA